MGSIIDSPGRTLAAFARSKLSMKAARPYAIRLRAGMALIVASSMKRPARRRPELPRLTQI